MRKNENGLARTHDEPSGIFRFIFFDSPSDPSKWKSLCVSMPTWGETLTARVDNVNAAGSYAKVEPHFPRILKHSSYRTGMMYHDCRGGKITSMYFWCTGARGNHGTQRKFLRINHVTMENAYKIIALISYEMFRRLYCWCSRRA